MAYWKHVLKENKGDKFMLINCPDCGKEVDDNLTKFPHCGF